MKPLLKVIQLYKNEKVLIKKASRQHREAQKQLFEMHAPKMLSVCRYYIKDMQHAEDVMLNGFLKVFSNLNDFKGEGSFEGWVRRIMVNGSISFLRKQKKMEVSFEDVKIQEGLTDEVPSDLDIEDIQKLIDHLPEGYKLVFVMHAIEGYKHHEIAQILNISEGTSKSQLFKAKNLLQQQINHLNNTIYGTR